MIVLVSADWHIKLRQKNVPIEWSKNRFSILFEEIRRVEKQVDMHIIAGDIFDSLPIMEELELYFNFVSKCSIETLILPGNHEALKKDSTFLSSLKQVTSQLNPLVRIIDDFETYKGIDFIPYNKLKEWAKTPEVFTATSKYLVSHFRAEIPPHVKPEVDLTLFEQWETVLAGDLHSYENSQLNILYPGSPITTSFHRSIATTGVIVFDTSTSTHTWVALEVPQLVRKTVGVSDPKPQTPYHHTIYEVEGNLEELSKMEDNILVDKKISRKTSEAALILAKEMTLVEEVKEYLTYILELPDNTIENVLLEMQSNIT